MGNIKIEIYDGSLRQKELLPCPFCGSKCEDGKDQLPYLYKETKKGFETPHYKVMCSNCGAEPDYCVETEDEAIIFWNKRECMIKSIDFINGFNSAKNKIKNIINMVEMENIDDH